MLRLLLERGHKRTHDLYEMLLRVALAVLSPSLVSEWVMTIGALHGYAL